MQVVPLRQFTVRCGLDSRGKLEIEIMRAGFGSNIDTSRESLRYAKQLGATDIIPAISGIPATDGTWAVNDLVKLRLRIEEYGMSLSAIENVPISFYDHIMLNGPRRGRADRKDDHHGPQHGACGNPPSSVTTGCRRSRGGLPKCRSGAARSPRLSITK